MGGRRSARLRDEGPPPAPPVERPATDAAAAAERRARAAARALEVEDSPRVLRDKCRRLARALRNAKHLVLCEACGILKNTTDSVGPFFKKVPTLSGVTHFDKVYTGAGISTAADIPDYRGPRGVWTRLRRGEAVGRVEVALARPTFTHMALRALWAQGALKFVVSQNCDGLHLRSGLPRRALAELHGDMFAEGCARCRRVYLRAFDTTERTARHRHGTRRLCHACGRELRDSIVHFGERGRAAWPLNWAGALRHAARADVVLCLGSSLKVLRRYPRLWRMHRAPSSRPQLYIVNLQWTPKDAVAALKINARCDAVMRQVARRLRLRVPRYSPRRDPLLAHAEPLAPPEAHTTRRAALRVSPAPASLSPLSSRSPSSPSPSDSDEELPLRRLADRLRGPSHADELHAFRVNLHSGEATILLRTEHAPHPAETSPPRNSTAELRRFRIVRRQGAGAGVPLSNGHCPLNEVPPLPKTEELPSETEQLLPKTELKLIKKEEDGHHRLVNGTKILTEDSKLPKWERSPSPGPLAAAIIARAVLMCRASLYSGLHTIIAPQTAPPPPASPPPEAPAREGATTVATAAGECEWCARRYSSTRCLWYGAPRRTPPESRAWRVVRGRRYLCACCASDDETRAAEARDEADGGGWYGKGYRKGRRRRR